MKLTKTATTVFTHDENFLVGWWRDATTGSMELWNAPLEAFLATANRPCASICVIPASHPGSTLEDRAAMGALANRVYAIGGGQCLIFLGRGFTASIHRSVATTVGMFLPRGRSLLVAEDLESLVKKLPQELAGHHLALAGLYAAADEALRADERA